MIKYVSLMSECNTVSLRNADTDFIVPFMKTSNGQKEFVVGGAKIWDELSCMILLKYLIKITHI